MNKHKESLFIVIEGIDCAGKSSLVEDLKKELLNTSSEIYRYFKGEIYFTSEPYGPQTYKNTVSKYLSNLIFSTEFKISPLSETLLFLASRSEHWLSFILPKLNKKSLVICDRFFMSTLVYQSYLKNVKLSWIENTMELISGKIIPDIVFNIEVMEYEYDYFLRLKKEREGDNKYDSDPLFTYFNLKEGYNWASEYLKNQGQNVIKLPPEASKNEKIETIIKMITRLRLI